MVSHCLFFITCNDMESYEGGTYMTFIWSLIIGVFLGGIASLITGRYILGDIIGNIIAGMIGAWIGSAIFEDYSYKVGGYAIISALIGAIILIVIVSFIMGMIRK